MAITGSDNPDTLLGTVLADVLSALGSDDLLFGYDGNDVLFGGDGDDFLYGGSGDDTLVGGAGEDFFYGQSGNDVASYASAAVGLTLDLTDTMQSTADARGDFFFSIEAFRLSGFDDVLIGTNAAQKVYAGAGNDLLQGFGGADQLSGEAGNDTLEGGAGADTLIGGGGFDIASYAGSSAAIGLDMAQPGLATADAAGDVLVDIDSVLMTAFNDALVLAGAIRHGDGGAGDDDLTDTTGANTLLGGVGNDILRDRGGADRMEGGAGNDTFFGGSGADSLFGGADFDQLRYLRAVRLDMLTPGANLGDAFGDVLDGIEAVAFTAGASSYVGGSANLSVIAAGSALTCIAGSGAEQFSRTSSTTMSLTYMRSTSQVQLATDGNDLVGSLAAAGDRLSGVTTLTLTNFADTLTMTAFSATAVQTLLAGPGADVLGLMLGTGSLVNAGAGDDQITGTVRGGTVIGGIGADLITLNGGGSGAAYAISGGDGNDVMSVDGYTGFGTVTGDAGADIISVGFSGMSSVDVDGGADSDQISVTAIVGTVVGGAGDDSITFNQIVTGAGGCALLGGEGNDTLTYAPFFSQSTLPGNSGLLNGGAGNDSLVGTSDGFTENFVVATFQFDVAWGDDRINNFNDGIDLIALRATGATSFADLTVSGGADFTDISFGLDSIHIAGLDVANFSAADVIFS